MKKNLVPLLVLALIFLVSIILQTSLLSVWSFFGAQPDLPGIIVILLGIMKGSTTGAIVGAGGGLLLDLTAGRLLGLNLFSKTVLGWLVGQVRMRVFINSVIASMLLVFVFSALDQLVLAIVTRAFGVGVPFDYALTKVILPTAGYNAILTLILYPILRKVDRLISYIQA